MARATCGYAGVLVLARGLLPAGYMDIIGATIAWGAIEPESIMPVQYADLRGSATAKSPVLRLMRAVLLDALRRRAHTLGRSDKRSRGILRETEAWFASDDVSWPFAFVIVCTGLGLEPESIRAALRGRKRDFRWQACR